LAKGYKWDIDAYSVVEQYPPFVNFLRLNGVLTVVICGLALNICCFHSAIDLRIRGFEVLVVEDASAVIDGTTITPTQRQAKVVASQLGIQYATTNHVMSHILVEESCPAKDQLCPSED